MRTHLLFAAALTAAVATPAAAQRGRRSDTTRSASRDGSATRSTQTFRPALHAGQRLSVSNIDGKVTVTQAQGISAEIVAEKVVRRGNGDLVKAVLEETSNGYRICTVYLNRANEDRGCEDRNHNYNDNDHSRDPLEVDMNFEVRLPAGVALAVNSVDGSVDARGIDTPGSIRSVDGSIDYAGVAPESLNTVDGSVTATITNNNWNHSLSVRSVDGSIELTLPALLNARMSGRTVDGSIDSDFPVTVVGKWGPHSFEGNIGNGQGASLEISTVDGGIRLRSSDGSRRTAGPVHRRP